MGHWPAKSARQRRADKKGSEVTAVQISLKKQQRQATMKRGSILKVRTVRLDTRRYRSHPVLMIHSHESGRQSSFVTTEDTVLIEDEIPRKSSKRRHL